MKDHQKHLQASQKQPPMPIIKGWSVFLMTLILLWVFGVAVGPWLQHYIYGMDEIVQVIEEQNIDAGAYFYTEIEGSYDGEKYLRQALETGVPDEFGLTVPFLSGIFLCFLILFLGWKYLPE